MEHTPDALRADAVRSFLPELPEQNVSEYAAGHIYDIAYQSILRVIATERHHARKAALQTSPTGYDAPSWNENWATDATNIPLVQDEHQDEIAFLRSHVALANDVVLAEATVHDPSDKRAVVQRALGKKIAQHITHPGKSKIAPGDTSLRNTIKGSGLAIVAPTGSGKTHMQAQALRAMKIGQSKMEGTEEHRRALVCVSDQALVNQYLGRIGDDNFRNILGRDVSVGAVWQHDKDATQDITVVVTSTLPTLIETGQITPSNYDVTIVDEGHRILGKRNLQTLAELGDRLLLFTATPTYSERKSLHRITEVASEGDVRGFVEQGILSPVRLLTYRPEKGAEFEAAAYLAAKVIQQGRKVLVYCRKSNGESEERHAEYVSRRINEQTIVEDGAAASAVVGIMNKAPVNRRFIEEFQNRSIRALVTVGMLREGYNDPDVDTVIIVGPSLSQLDIEQKVGRCLRKNDKEALAIEIIPQRDQHDMRQYYSIWNVFELEQIRQGKLIDELEEAFPLTEGINADLSAAKQPRRERKEVVEELALPAHLGGYYEQGLVRSITLSPESNQIEELKEGSMSLEEIALTHSLPRSWLVYRFDRAKLPYTSVYNFDADTGERRYERWYDAEILGGYLEQHPLPLGGERFTFESVTKILGATRGSVRAMLKRLEITGERGIEAKMRETVTYSMQDIKKIEQEIERIPVANEEDISFAALQKEFKERGWPSHFPHSFVGNEENNITLYERRVKHSENTGVPQAHLSSEDARRVREGYLKVSETPTEAYISLEEVAKLASVSFTLVSARITDEDRIGSRWFKRTKKARVSLYLERQRGIALIDRLEPKKLPPHLLPIPTVAARIRVPKGTLQGYIHRNREKVAPKVMNLGFKDNRTFITCTTWDAVQEIEEKYGLKPDTQPIDFQRIADGDTSYMREIQSLHIDEKYLEPVAEWTPATEAEQMLHCTAAALPILVRLVTSNTAVTEAMQKQPGGWMILTETLERMKRYPLRDLSDQVSHTNLLLQLRKESLQWPTQYSFTQGDRTIGKGARGMTDIYYSLPLAKSILHTARIIKRRQ